MSFKMIPLTEIYVPRYQRPLDTRRITKYANNFNPSLLGVLKVSANLDGTFNIIDGQHRLEVLKKLQIPEAWCEVEENITPEQEANLFVKLQTERQAVKPFDRQRALVLAGDEKAIALQNLLSDLGLRFSAGGGATVSGITAVNIFNKTYDQYGPAILSDALRTILSAYPQERDAVRFRGELVQGLCYFMIRYPRVTIDVLSERLSRITPQKLLRDAISYRETSSETARSVATQILRIYNVGRSTRRLEPERLHERISPNKITA